MAYLNSSYNATLDVIDELEANGWLDNHTVTVSLEMAIYNGNTDLVTTCIHLVNFPPMGSSERETTCDIVSYSRLTNTHVNILHVVLMILFLLYTLVQMCIECQIWQHASFTYLHVTEACSIAASLLLVAFVVVDWTDSRVLAERKNTDWDPVTVLQYVGTTERIIRAFCGIVIFIACLKFIALLRLFPRCHRTMLAIGNCVAPVLRLTVCFVVLMFMAASVFFLLFVEGSVEFSSVLESFKSLFFGVLGEPVSRSAFSDHSLTIGPLLYLGCCFLVTILLLNIVTAIVLYQYFLVWYPPSKHDTAAMFDLFMYKMLGDSWKKQEQLIYW